jgi:hypothetical protein
LFSRKLYLNSFGNELRRSAQWKNRVKNNFSF